MLSDWFDIWNHVSDRLRHEGTKNELPEFSVILTLVEEDGLLSEHPLFARRKSWFEQMRFRNQDELGSFRARDHHTWASQYMSLEHRSVSVLPKRSIKIQTFFCFREQNLDFFCWFGVQTRPSLFWCEEHIWVLWVKLERFAYVRITHCSRRKREFRGGVSTESGYEPE